MLQNTGLDQGSPNYSLWVWSTKPFYPAGVDILSIIKNDIFVKNLLICLHISKQSHYIRCPALRLLCNSLHEPQTKKFGDPCSRPLLYQMISLTKTVKLHVFIIGKIPQNVSQKDKKLIT